MRTMQTDVINIFSFFIRYWRLVSATIAVSVIACLIYFFTLAPFYKAEVSILPRAGSSNSSILGRIASLSGAFPESEQNLEDLYSTIVFSDAVLDTIANSRWQGDNTEKPGYLWEMLDLNSPVDATREQLLELTNRHLRRDVVTFDRNYDNGFMVLKVTIKNDPLLAANLANGIVHELDRFIVEFRTRKSVEKRVFLDERLAEIETELGNSNSMLTEFVASNRNYTGSPILAQRYAKMEREVQAQNAIWIEVRRQLSIVKVEANRQTVSIDVLDPATPPLKRSGPFPLFYAGYGFILGTLASILFLGIKHIWMLTRGATAS